MTLNRNLINPESVSFKNILSDLQTYLEALPDYSKWKDFYSTGAGVTQLELLSALGAFLQFHAMGQRRESYIDTARVFSSVVNICSILGYPVNRLSAPRIKIQFLNNQNTFWDRSLPLFFYKNLDISLLNSQTLPSGLLERECIIGNWNSLTNTVSENMDYYMVEVPNTQIDNNQFFDTLELFVNNNPVEIVRYSDNMLPNSAVLKTTSNGIVLLFGDGVVGKKVFINDIITFNYVTTQGQLENLLRIEPQEITSQIDSTIQNIEILTPGYSYDSIDKLKLLGPGYLSTKRRMVTDKDHEFILLSYSGSMISTAYQKDIAECCTIYLSYLFDDEHLATIPEKDSIYLYLDDYKVAGTQILLKDPERVGIEVKVTLIVEEGVTQAQIEDEITEIVNRHTFQLNTPFYPGVLTKELSEITGVNRVYIERPVSDRVNSYHNYFKMISLEVVVTSNQKYVVNINPDNDGYWKFFGSGRITTLQQNQLVDSTADFSSILPGAFVISFDTNAKSTVLQVIDLHTLSLSNNVFTEEQQTYEVYSHKI